MLKVSRKKKGKQSFHLRNQMRKKLCKIYIETIYCIYWRKSLITPVNRCQFLLEVLFFKIRILFCATLPNQSIFCFQASYFICLCLSININSQRFSNTNLLLHQLKHKTMQLNSPHLSKSVQKCIKVPRKNVSQILFNHWSHIARVNSRKR